MGSLPEGFCGTPQELAQAIADRLIIQSDPVFSSFAIGSTAPTSNIGPWLKDCLTWFVWDDATSTYIPELKDGFNTQKYFSASTTFIVPENIYKLRVSAWGGGGGGGDSSGGTGSGGGGGGGGFSVRIQDVSPGENIVLVIGAAGATGLPFGANGGNTTVADDAGIFLTCLGGSGGDNNNGGAGGTSSGGDYNMTGGAGGAAFGGAGLGGDAGGGGGKAGNIGLLLANRRGTAPGGGGAGGILGVADPLGGPGAAGGCLIEY